MKFLSTALLALLLFVAGAFYSVTTRAQARPSPATQVVSVDVLPAAFSYPISLQYEIKADPTDSWLFRLNYWPSPLATWSGFGLGGAYRFYVMDSRALTGLSVGPTGEFFLFNQSQQAGGQGTRSGFSVAIGADVAYKWIWDPFALEPIVGLRYGFGSSSTPPAATTIYPLLGCSLGYAW